MRRYPLGLSFQRSGVCFNFIIPLYAIAEQTVQQEETPQPPPEKRGGGAEGITSLSDDAQLKEDITFFTSLDEHLGHSVAFSGGYKLCKRANFSLHSWQTYS